MNKYKIGIYPGTFDPITNGHINVIKRAIPLFDKLIIAVAMNPAKNTFFSFDERLNLVKEATKDIKNVEVLGFKGLIVDFAKKVKSNVIVRGLRAISDFEYEFQMALSNYKIAKVETVFLMTSLEYSYVSSTLIKEISLLGGDISYFVPKIIISAIKRKINENRGK